MLIWSPYFPRPTFMFPIDYALYGRYPNHTTGALLKLFSILAIAPGSIYLRKLQNTPVEVVGGVSTLAVLAASAAIVPLMDQGYTMPRGVQWPLILCQG